MFFLKGKNKCICSSLKQTIPHEFQAEHVFGEMANSRSKTTMARNAPRVKKGGHKSPRMNKSIIENNGNSKEISFSGASSTLTKDQPFS